MMAFALLQAAGLILTNGNIYTQDRARPRVEAVAIQADRVVYVGDDAGAARFAGPGTRRIDLKGATVVPGLIDAHGHVESLGHLDNQLDVKGTGSADEIAASVAARAADLPAGRWILGRGWDQNDWKETSFPSRLSLDAAAPNHPVSLSRVDGHALWVNTAALRAAGITKATPDPAGGQIIRDASGEPTGILVDLAADLIEAKIPAPTRDEIRQALLAGMKRCLAAGLTGVHDAGVTQTTLELYHELVVKGDFPFRVYAMLAGEAAVADKPMAAGWLDRRLEMGPEIGLGGGRLTVRALKLYMDGALGSRGAALLAPYDDDPGNRGLLRTDPVLMRRLAERAARAGFQVCIHAIGDRGNRLALDALEAAGHVDGAGGVGRPGGRHRIEHAQVLAPEDLPRFAALGVVASMQPTHATSDMYWVAERIGARRVAGSYAWKSLLDSGARLACGSDFPVESEAPLAGFYAAVTRQDAKGWPEGGWTPSERLSREQALSCFTRDAAWAAFEEDQRGSIAPGKLADLTVLSADIMKIPAARILETNVLMTIVGGRVAYERK